jgi:thiamine-phosphate pyrophosphorylase
MPRTTPNLQPPITYLITSGDTTPATTPSSREFAHLLKLIEAAVAARISLIQIREKNLTARLVYELAMRAAAITHGSATLLLINDRADIASAAGADGVHLTTRSLEPAVIRQTFGADFLIGASTHSIAEARRAQVGGADFIVFGPVFETGSKEIYGAPVGLGKLKEIAVELAPFPVLALGGVTTDNARDCFHAGATGIAGISLFGQASDLQSIVRVVQDDGR